MSDGKKAKPKSNRRPLQYTEAIGDEVCGALARGESLKAICLRPGMPSEETVRRWVLEPDHPIAQRYQLAKLMSYHRMADELLSIADDTSKDYHPDRTPEGKKVVDEKAISRSKLMVDTRRWLLSKVLPRIYGDKVEVGGKDGGPIQIEHTGMTDLEASRRMVLMLFEQVTAEGGSSGDAMKLLNGSIPNDEAQS